jgi:hypothetical protein
MAGLPEAALVMLPSPLTVRVAPEFTVNVTLLLSVLEMVLPLRLTTALPLSIVKLPVMSSSRVMVPPVLIFSCFPQWDTHFSNFGR